MTKRRRPKHKSLKKSPVLAKRKKCSPIIHLPLARHTPSRPQKRIKLASTEANQDQVVPLCSILHPTLKIPHPSSTKRGTGRGRIGRGRAGSQTVPYSPQGRKEGVQQENLDTNETGGKIKRLFIIYWPFVQTDLLTCALQKYETCYRYGYIIIKRLSKFAMFYVKAAG